MRLIVILALSVAAVAAAPTKSERIIGGTITTIGEYPYAVALLSTFSGDVFVQSCGATIINNRSILSASHCFMFQPLASQWRSRVGSTMSNSGGVVYNSAEIIRHPDFSIWTADNDMAIIRTDTEIYFSNFIQPGRIAGPNYFLADNESVWAVGWGHTTVGGVASPELRHVQIWTVNQAECRQRYATVGRTVTDNMLCSGWLDVGGRDQCQGDSGGPLFHQGVVVGVCSWGRGCADPVFPGVNARVSRFTTWITSNA